MIQKQSKSENAICITKIITKNRCSLLEDENKLEWKMCGPHLKITSTTMGAQQNCKDLISYSNYDRIWK